MQESLKELKDGKDFIFLHLLIKQVSEGKNFSVLQKNSEKRPHRVLSLLTNKYMQPVCWLVHKMLPTHQNSAGLGQHPRNLKEHQRSAGNLQKESGNCDNGEVGGVEITIA